ncbi:MAG TPA: hypothetical protein VJ464_01280 [Blastocatellia bacterium]|nr:hypothetical protein [Blastocatellia bacterium]
MDIELVVKILGSVSAALAIGERVYSYGQKAGQKIKRYFHANTHPSLPTNRPLTLATGASPKKNLLVLLCKRNQLSPFLEAAVI